MKKSILFKLIIFVILSMVFASCGINNKPSPQVQKPLAPLAPHQEKTVSSAAAHQDGKIMILMYHQFKDHSNNEWTRTFEGFRKDLETLYSKGYRPISLKDYMNKTINIPSGFTPVVFTFDDGTLGQFNLIQKDGQLMANPNSAVGIMEAFNKLHPDFALKGTFFINYTNFFAGKGTNKERLEYLIAKGFDIGNHTMDHPILSKVATAEKIQQEIGEHAKKTAELIPGYVVDQLALPNGITSKRFPQYVQIGQFSGTNYENKAILLVGSGPAPSPFNPKVDFLKLPRIRALGDRPVELDMYYWLDYFDKHPKEKYIQ
jgi:peptidoglycan/xylan/chitin deacetylase (PgdA/CDA1 family)